MHIRDRIKDLRRLRAGDLRPIPRTGASIPNSSRMPSPGGQGGSFQPRPVEGTRQRVAADTMMTLNRPQKAVASWRVNFARDDSFRRRLATNLRHRRVDGIRRSMASTYVRFTLGGLDWSSQPGPAGGIRQRAAAEIRTALRRNSFYSLITQSSPAHTTPPQCGITLPRFRGRILVRRETWTHDFQPPAWLQ
jgi:hypothetical protein